MISEAPGTINFTMFLTLFGEKMTGTDPEHEILQAFETFDPAKTGLINADILREAMTTMGDRFTDEEVIFAFAFLFSPFLMSDCLLSILFWTSCSLTPSNLIG